uniref:Uncharacterized protein n=1 Tax=Pseudo-nitzschia delicatissima TaxID=44447 RepID=A0A7S0Y5U7_9STRA
MIQKSSDEIAIGPLRLLSCETFDAIHENAPNLAFVNYKQAAKLQRLLSKHHCPTSPHDLKENTGGEKPPMSIVLEATGQIVPIEQWLEAKSELLEYVLRMKSDWSCQTKMRDVQEELFACPDEALQISGRSYDNQKVSFQFI